jgi:hypothetical protein
MPDKTSPAVVALGAALHLVYCEVSARPAPGWAAVHHEDDWRTAVRVLAALRVDGWQLVPADPPGPALSSDFVDMR